jgi:dipeptidase E
MKLLLTSGGITNSSIAEALEDLVGKKPGDIQIAFIPTAANPERGEKDWLIRDLYRLLEHGYHVDIIELTAMKADALREALETTDVIFVGGGNTFYLSYWMQKSGLASMLPELLKTKVYAGISAGSMVAGTSLVLSSQAMNDPKSFEDEDYNELGPAGESSGKTLSFADLIFRPHLNSRFFTLARADLIEERLQGINTTVYALDDSSALKIVNNTITVVGEGEWTVFNEKKT